MASPQTNYIQHFTTFVEIIQSDKRLTGNHVSLYVALFSIWNQCYFRNPFQFSRTKALSISHIGSGKTYYKCLKDLEDFGYIRYFPSRIKGRSSSASITPVIIRKNDPPAGADINAANIRSAPPKGANVPHITNNTSSINKGRGDAPSPNKKNNQEPGAISKPENLNDVVAFFHLLGQPETEAAKFFHHYEANGWRQAGKVPITNWPAAARKWILNIHPTQTLKNGKRTKSGNLHSNQDKSYSDPL